MLTRKNRRAGRGCAQMERMEERCLLSAAFGNGTNNAIAYDAAGRLWVAYYDAAAKNLKYSLRNADGTWAVSAGLIDGQTDPAGPAMDVGQGVSMVIERGGLPGVAYTDAINADLKYAHFNGTSWDVTTVEQFRTTGYYPSIAFNPATNRPAISYYYKTNGDLRLRQFNGSNWGTDTDYQLIDGAAGDAGRYSILRYDPLGRWAVAYDDTSASAAKYSYQMSGGVWSTSKVIDDTVSDVAFTDMTFDSAKRPAVSYYDSSPADLKFARAADTNGANAWTAVALAGASNTAGKYTNLMYDAATDKFTVYYSQESGSNPLKINYRTGNIGAWEDDRTLYAGGASELRVLKTPGVAGGVTYSWSATDTYTGQQNLYVNDSTTGTVWRQETADAGFVRVQQAGAVVHTVNGVAKIFVIDGTADVGSPGVSGSYGGASSVVRVSGDGGATWSWWAPQGANGGPAPAARTEQTVVSFRGKLWMIGGKTDNGVYFKDAWSSPDGVAWTREADLPAGFAARSEMASAVSSDGSTLYLIGGWSPVAAGGSGFMTYYADVWSTTDGQTWTQQSASAPFGIRRRAGAVYFDNRLWLLGGVAGDAAAGGSEKDDAWFSTDGGATWTCAAASGGYGVREGLSAVVHDNRMWVMGGDFYYGGGSNIRNSAWYSFDGVSWTQAAQGTPLNRTDGGAVSVGGRLVYVFGRDPNVDKNDVWSAA